MSHVQFIFVCDTSFLFSVKCANAFLLFLIIFIFQCKIVNFGKFVHKYRSLNITSFQDCAETSLI